MAGANVKCSYCPKTFGSVEKKLDHEVSVHGKAGGPTRRGARN